MKTYLMLLQALLTAGCTIVGVRTPIGVELPADQTEAFIGEWIGPKQTIVSVARLKDSPSLVASWREDGESKVAEFLVTKVGDECIVMWGNVGVSSFTTPVRALLSEDSIVLLVPDQKEVEALIASGMLKRAPEGDKTRLLIESDGLLSTIASKTFWDITWAVPLLRKGKNGEPGATDNPDDAQRLREDH